MHTKAHNQTNISLTPILNVLSSYVMASPAAPAQGSLSWRWLWRVSSCYLHCRWQHSGLHPVTDPAFGWPTLQPGHVDNKFLMSHFSKALNFTLDHLMIQSATSYVKHGGGSVMAWPCMTLCCVNDVSGDTSIKMAYDVYRTILSAHIQSLQNL